MTPRLHFLGRLGKAQAGSATVEFAIMSLFFFGVMLVALDFGLYQQQRLKFSSAVEQGAILAFNSRDTINASTIATFVQTAAGLSAAPTVTCNNGGTCAAAAARDPNSDYRCINPTTGAIDTTAYALTGTCSNGSSKPGYYLKIVASKTYNAVAVPDAWLGGTTMTQTTIVRLQ